MVLASELVRMTKSCHERGIELNFWSWTKVGPINRVREPVDLYLLLVKAHSVLFVLKEANDPKCCKFTERRFMIILFSFNSSPVQCERCSISYYVTVVVLLISRYLGDAPD